MWVRFDCDLLVEPIFGHFQQLMLNQSLDAGNAGGRVGYESASQLSREYSRLFGAPPQRDIRRMRLSQSS